MNERSTSLKRRIESHLLESARIKQQAAEQCSGEILASAELISDCFRSGGKVLLCGNGGSAADCQHMATELLSHLSRGVDRPALPAIALTTDTSFLTAFSNDVCFEGVFARQVQALGHSGDVLIGISTSGDSVNVIRAMEAAKTAKMRTIALSGSTGRLASMADVAILVPCNNTQYIQETHLAIEHVLCELVEHLLFFLEPIPTEASI